MLITLQGIALHILVVEDEEKVASFIRKGLEADGYVVDLARDGELGVTKLTERPYDLVLLDVMLPKLDGITLLQQIRILGLDTPVLMLTARDTVSDKITGLDHGADDYLTKPFDFEELLARIRALLRRGRAIAITVYRLADLELDLASRKVTRGGTIVELTVKEFSLLEFFLRHPGRVLSRAVIAQHVWGVDFDTFTNVIDVYVNYLRKKIDTDPENKLIRTVRGIGYMLGEPGE